MTARQPNRDYLSSFGRNRGRSLRPYQQGLVDNLLPQLAVDPQNLPEKVAIEIGYGAGEHLVAQARHNPDTLFIGCEPFINGVAKCLARIDAEKIKNIRLFTDDARKLLLALPDNSIGSAFILFPDPWPKARHVKRRLVNPETLAMLHRIQKPGARLLLATDHVDYSIWMLELLRQNPHYEWLAERAGDFTTPPADWTETKYQRKTTAQGREPVFMECVRK